ncbi:MAG: hypothetical protein PUD59_01310 [bacterium]|nr:hypothetical protein [bacterium]
MGCNSCKYLKYEKRNEGKTNGAIYWCMKNKQYVNGAKDECDKYELDNIRKTYIRDEIYLDGEKYYNGGDHNLIEALFLIFLIILGLILGVFNV